MSNFIDMLSYRKGDGCTYRPDAGTTCQMSGPNCDNDDGYTYIEVEILWKDDLFVVYRHKDCWPVVNKWEHVRCKADPTPNCPQPETPIRERAWTDAQITAAARALADKRIADVARQIVQKLHDSPKSALSQLIDSVQAIDAAINQGQSND